MPDVPLALENHPSRQLVAAQDAARLIRPPVRECHPEQRGHQRAAKILRRFAVCKGAAVLQHDLPRHVLRLRRIGDCNRTIRPFLLPFQHHVDVSEACLVDGEVLSFLRIEGHTVLHRETVVHVFSVIRLHEHGELARKVRVHLFRVQLVVRHGIEQWIGLDPENTQFPVCHHPP